MSGAAATTIIEHLSATPRDSWHRVGEVAQVENFTPAEIGDAIGRTPVSPRLASTRQQRKA